MTTDRPDHRTDSSGTWALAAFGAFAIAVLMAAMVWVVQGQVQQAQVLRAQWQGTPRTLQVTRAEVGPDAVPSQAGNSSKPLSANGIMATSFDSP